MTAIVPGQQGLGRRVPTDQELQHLMTAETTAALQRGDTFTAHDITERVRRTTGRDLEIEHGRAKRITHAVAQQAVAAGHYTVQQQVPSAGQPLWYVPTQPPQPVTPMITVLDFTA